MIRVVAVEITQETTNLLNLWENLHQEKNHQFKTLIVASEHNTILAYFPIMLQVVVVAILTHINNLGS